MLILLHLFMVFFCSKSKKPNFLCFFHFVAHVFPHINNTHTHAQKLNWSVSVKYKVSTKNENYILRDDYSRNICSTLAQVNKCIKTTCTN